MIYGIDGFNFQVMVALPLTNVIPLGQANRSDVLIFVKFQWLCQGQDRDVMMQVSGLTFKKGVRFVCGHRNFDGIPWLEKGYAHVPLSETNFIWFP